MVYSSYHLFTRISSINPRNLQQDPLNGPLNLSIPSSFNNFFRGPLVRSHSIFDGITRLRELTRILLETENDVLNVATLTYPSASGGVGSGRRNDEHLMFCLAKHGETC